MSAEVGEKSCIGAKPTLVFVYLDSVTEQRHCGLRSSPLPPSSLLIIPYLHVIYCHKPPTGQMNPAVSLALCLNGHITVLRALMYIGAQIVGGIVGSALARALRYIYIYMVMV